jgi:hypothetical protein
MDLPVLLVIVHVLLFAYWLGADWGVFVTARYVADPQLSIEERLRFLRAAFRIDLLPRVSFTLLLPVGIHLASFYGAVPATDGFLAFVWIAALAWTALNIAGYLKSGQPAGDRIRTFDQGARLVLAPVLIGVGAWSVLVGSPVGVLFVALKLALFGLMIIVGLVLRAIMKNWAEGFRRLATEGRSAEVDALFARSLARARYLAIFMWSLSGAMAVLGIARPA